MISIAAGVGRIVLDVHGEDAIFTELSYAYPLKLLSPRLNRPKVGVAYVVSYGGGLVGGDQVDLIAVVQKDGILVMLTQGTTKVFKSRAGRTPIARADASLNPSVTRQRLHVSVPSNGALFLLPEPVTCFRSANYHQIQTIHLSSSASLVLLDWYTSGRKSIGEEWVFERYYSLNDVHIDGKRIARDATLLEDTQPSSASPVSPTTKRQGTLADRMAPYSCYASVLLYGPLTKLTRDQLWAAYEATTVFKQPARPNIVWSISPFSTGQGAVGLQSVVGVDIYRKALG
ncbi:hypothetical protein EUX98_g635 [Antrodiella citrinella]|uniref:Urease accessory protein UreD n=1 Tax=Antrodiella citrinella TaxID=2447956 RepID=A0A4S4N3G4_9APHY|nr:hypothetical protein EUX98_g635 [Antrodiella citrinella]